MSKYFIGTIYMRTVIAVVALLLLALVLNNCGMEEFSGHRWRRHDHRHRRWGHRGYPGYRGAYYDYSFPRYYTYPPYYYDVPITNCVELSNGEIKCFPNDTNVVIVNKDQNEKK
jgi:hypothetical protein